MSKHTPGPWAVRGGMTPLYTIITAPEQLTCIVGQFSADVHELEEHRANARLIAAAPELLEACRALMGAESMQQGARGGAIMGAISTAIDKARAAIAKAEGEGHA